VVRAHGRAVQAVPANFGGVALAGLGGALVPPSALPGWAEAVASGTPSYWAMRGFRSVILDSDGAAGIRPGAYPPPLWRRLPSWPRSCSGFDETKSSLLWSPAADVALQAFHILRGEVVCPPGDQPVAARAASNPRTRSREVRLAASGSASSNGPVPASGLRIRPNRRSSGQACALWRLRVVRGILYIWATLRTLDPLMSRRSTCPTSGN
jgi:hypothetical protein